MQTIPWALLQSREYETVLLVSTLATDNVDTAKNVLVSLQTFPAQWPSQNGVLHLQVWSLRHRQHFQTPNSELPGNQMCPLSKRDTVCVQLQAPTSV
jgi:hypothetical protein